MSSRNGKRKRSAHRPANSNRAVESPRILFEDEHLLALAKPPGLHVFPSKKEGDSFIGRLIESRPELGGLNAPLVVHRLDRGTSGVLLVAKNEATYSALRESFRRRRVVKTYVVLVEGTLAEEIEVNQPLGARYRRSKTVSVLTPGRRLRGIRPARTQIFPLERSGGFTLCRVIMRTGVRHQIRAHLKHLGHPVAGDILYGASLQLEYLAGRLFLHAWSVELRHPDNGSNLRILCPLGADLDQALSSLGMSDAIRRFRSDSDRSAG